MLTSLTVFLMMAGSIVAVIALGLIVAATGVRRSMIAIPVRAERNEAGKQKR